MPELPEVEIAARNLRRWAQGRAIRSAWCDPHAARMFRPHSARAVTHALAGHRVMAVDRRGKNLLITLLDPRGATSGVLSHLGMTGKWVKPAEAVTHARVKLVLDDGAVLVYRDPRMFGRVRLVPEARFDDVPELRALGPDPLVDGVDLARLLARFAGTARSVKAVVMDQAVLAGVGNIQASEGLFRAGIDPRRGARSLSRAEVARVREGVLATLHATIAREDGPEITYVEEAGAPNPFDVYGHAGAPCPRCARGVIARVVQGGRASFYCPRCQR